MRGTYKGLFALAPKYYFGMDIGASGFSMYFGYEANNHHTFAKKSDNRN